MVYFFQYWHLPQDGVLKMLRIFVTGDNHIGLKYASHEQAAILASSRMAAFEGMVKTEIKKIVPFLRLRVTYLKILTAYLRRKLKSS